jgi:hypothetical protein
MVVMLRTQGVPARYVVGYAPGEAVGEDRYLVTADRGHAWVEAYFPGTGWIRFDPTGSGRLPVEAPQPPYDISLNRSAVAGAEVTVSVQKNGTPVVGAPVTVDGERVGWTDAAGRVETTLPYAPESTITATRPGAETKYDGDRDGDGGSDGEDRDASSGATNTPQIGGDAITPRIGWGAPPVDASLRRGEGRRYGAGEPPVAVFQRETAANASSRTYRSETNVTLSVGGRPVTGGGVTVAAAIRDVPLRGAAVSVDGDRVGRTDEDGTLAVSLADVPPGAHTIRVRRDGIGAATTVRVRTPNGNDAAAAGPAPIDVSVDAPLGVALPGGPATVTTTRNGSPVASATVVVAGTAAGRTDANGSLGVTLPMAGSATVLAQAGQTTARTTVTGLYRNAAVLGVIGGGLLGGVVWWCRRRGVTAGGVARAVTSALSALSARAVAASLRVAELLVRASRAVDNAGRRLAKAPAWLVAVGHRLFAGVGPLALARRLRRWLVGLVRRERGSAERAVAEARGGGGEASATTERPGAPPSLRAVWREFVSLVAPPNAATRTPGEIARYAVDRGLPTEPVRVLTDAYRDAEYGRLAPDDDRLARVRAAMERLRDATRGGRR